MLVHERNLLSAPFVAAFAGGSLEDAGGCAEVVDASLEEAATFYQTPLLWQARALKRAVRKLAPNLFLTRRPTLLSLFPSFALPPSAWF